VATIAGEAGHRLCHIMLPKVESVDDDVAGRKSARARGGRICRCTC
jgi:citrate lyase subunit beta/citryl-CoA lyase